QAHRVAFAVDHRAAGVAADDVVVGDEVERRGEIQRVLRPDPAVRQLERIGAGGAPVSAGEVGERRHLMVAFLPADYLAVGQAQGEGGVGVVAGAFAGEAGLGDRLVGLGGGRL